MTTYDTPARPKRSWRRIITRLFIGLLGVLVLIQFVPYGRAHANPPVTGEPQWDSEQTKALFARGCADCHSNQTKWPWYTNVAPVSWMITNHVNDGRREFNVSEWGRAEENNGDEAAEQVQEGEMPLANYLPMHPEAQFTAEERQQLINGLIATFGQKQEGSEQGEQGEQGEGGEKDDK